MNMNPTGRSTFGPKVCVRKHCNNPATCTVVARIPAKDCLIPEHEPISVAFAACLCDGCYERTHIGEFMTARLRRDVTALCRRMDKATPDFKKAYKEKGPTS